jgi:hypothetical protein
VAYALGRICAESGDQRRVLEKLLRDEDEEVRKVAEYWLAESR